MASKDEHEINDMMYFMDFKMEIEQVFEPEDCTMVMEDYGKCQDYPCNDCVTRFLKNYKGDN